MNKPRVLIRALVLLASVTVPALAAVPDTIIKILKVESDEITYQNTGTVDIGAVVVQAGVGTCWTDYADGCRLAW